MVQYRQKFNSPASGSAYSNSYARLMTLIPDWEIYPLSHLAANAPDLRDKQHLLVQTKLLCCFAEAIRLCRIQSKDPARLAGKDIWEFLLSQVCIASHWEYGEIWRPSADRTLLQCSASHYLHSDRLQNFRQWRQTLTFSPGVGLPGRVWQSQQPEWERVTIPTLEAQWGLRGALALPVSANDFPLAVLVFFTQDDRQPEVELVELLEAIAAQMGTLDRDGKQIERDRLLWGVAKAANHLLGNPDCQTAVAQALETLGKAAGVDRVCLCEQTSLSGRSVPLSQRLLGRIVKFEWAKNLEQASEPMGLSSESFRVEIDPFRQWYATLAAGEPVRVLASTMAQSHRFALGGMVSLLMLPIHIDGELWGYLGFGDACQVREWSARDISILQEIALSFGSAFRRYQAETTIRHQAFHDALTDLPNRTLFDLRLSWAITEARVQNHQLAVMFLDLDRFKWINDTLGHPVGDELLRQMVRRLQGCLRDGDTIARWGGDEFVLLLPQIHGVEDATQIAQRILGEVQPPFAIDNHQLHVSCSIGIAVYPYDGEDAATLTKNADVALYQVKEHGRNNYQLYQPAMSVEAAETLVLRNSLPYAIARQQLAIFYHPQFNTETAQITGMEALTYWQHPDLGLVSPKTFIPLAEEMGLMDAIGRWVLYTACGQNQAWQERGFAQICIAINLSERQFRQPDLLSVIQQVLAETQLNPQFLELEITEATALKNIEFTRSTLEKLQELGIRITMDDFGIGYASLSSLKRLPFNKVKIDRSFMRELTIDSSDTAMINAILALGRGLNLSVVAEGVETEEHRNLLRQLCCKDIQGYLMSLPLNAEDATQLLESTIAKSS